MAEKKLDILVGVKGAKEAEGAFSRLDKKLDSFKAGLGKRSAFGELTETLAGAGAVGGLAFALHQLEAMVKLAGELKQAFDAGTKSAGEIGYELAKSTPLVGGLVGSIYEMFDPDIAAENLAKKQAAAQIKAIEVIRKTRRDANLALMDPLTQERFGLQEAFDKKLGDMSDARKAMTAAGIFDAATQRSMSEAEKQLRLGLAKGLKALDDKSRQAEWDAITAANRRLRLENKIGEAATLGLFSTLGRATWMARIGNALTGAGGAARGFLDTDFFKDQYGENAKLNKARLEALNTASINGPAPFIESQYLSGVGTQNPQMVVAQKQLAATEKLVENSDELANKFTDFWETFKATFPTVIAVAPPF